MNVKCELFNDNFQNYKKYGIPKAQLVIADIPYHLGNNAYASSPEWYEGGDNKNGESKKAGKSFFHTDNNFNIAEYFHFCKLNYYPSEIDWKKFGEEAEYLCKQLGLDYYIKDSLRKEMNKCTTE